MKTRYITIIFILFVLVINSCDKVTPPYIESRDYCGGNKKVLIEDYTGHACNNCPEAAVLAHELKEFFCDKVVIIAVHAGYFATPYLYGDSLLSRDFNTEAGSAWDTFFGNSSLGNPNGLIDRVDEEPNGYVHYTPTWAKTTDALLMENAKAMIVINNDFNTDNKILTTSIKTEFIEEVSGNYKVIVCITQDSIIAPQYIKTDKTRSDGIDLNYVHNHVLRGSVNGIWGENLSTSGTVENNTTYEKTYTQEFTGDWIPADCHVVAFVYNEETYQVIQVEELGVLE